MTTPKTTTATPTISKKGKSAAIRAAEISAELEIIEERRMALAAERLPLIKTMIENGYGTMELSRALGIKKGTASVLAAHARALKRKG